MILVNGMPKSGTHAVMAWLSRMGLKRCPGVMFSADGRVQIAGKALSIGTLLDIPDNVFMQAHVAASLDLGGFCVLTVLRDPRNVLVSYCRHRSRHDELEVSIAEAIKDFWGQPFVPLYRDFLGWRGKSIVVRYEDLVADHVGDGASIYDDQPEWDSWIGNTRTGAPSNWEDHWDDEAERAFVESDGLDLLDRAGYI